jgi:hypothetical protein
MINAYFMIFAVPLAKFGNFQNRKSGVWANHRKIKKLLNESF